VRIVDELERLEEQRVQASRAVKKLSLIRDRAHSNVFGLEGMATNPMRRSELVQKCEDVARMLDAELREAQMLLEDTEADLEIARKQTER
jgi:hypothetical protein